MKTSIRTLAMSTAFVAFTTGIALAQGSTPAPAPAKKEATPAPAAKAEAKESATTEAKESPKTEAKEHAMAGKTAASKVSAEDIKDVQEALTKGGFYKGEATGKWDKASKSALKAWQKANKMKANGKLTKEVMDKLKMS